MATKMNINGKTYTVDSLNGLHIGNGKVIVNGKEIFPDGDSNIPTTSGDVRVGGNVAEDVTTVSGEVVVKGDIKGNIKTVSGDIIQK